MGGPDSKTLGPIYLCPAVILYIETATFKKSLTKLFVIENEEAKRGKHILLVYVFSLASLWPVENGADSEVLYCSKV